MKEGFLILMMFATGCAWTHAQQAVPEITIGEANDHVGEKVTICGEIKETFFNAKAKGETTMLNFGDAYPNHAFSCIIWKDDLANLDYKPAPHLKGKHVCVTGTLKMYKGKPEMEAHSHDQVYG
jgi:hypothetical protein